MTQTKTIAVSESELALINLEREKAELKKKEADLKKAEQRIKAVGEAKAKIAKALDKNKEYVAAIHSFFDKIEKEFPGEFSLVKVKDLVHTEERWDYVHENNQIKKDENNDYVRDIYFSEEYKEKQFEIRYKGFKEPHIYVKEHITSKSWDRHTTSNGFKMKVSIYGEDRYYTNVKTVREKIVDKLDTDSRQKTQEIIHENGIPFVLKKVRETYGKQLESVEEYCHNVKADFKNGMTVIFHYKFDEKKTPMYEVIIMEIQTAYMNKQDVLNALVSIKKLT